MNEKPNADRQQVSRDLLSSRFAIRLQKIMPIHLDRVFSSQNREKKKIFVILPMLMVQRRRIEFKLVQASSIPYCCKFRWCV